MHDWFDSRVAALGPVEFPTFGSTRIMMMPVILGDLGSLPDDLARWRPLFGRLCDLAPFNQGTAYLTIDERVVPAGATHRRPGIHVDGIGEDGSAGAYGGGGGYGKSGMLLAASHLGCRAWEQRFDGAPGPDGDCASLAAQCRADAERPLTASVAFWCGPLTVHEALPMASETARQFARLSGPSDAPWHEGYTANPLGIPPTGRIAPRRPEHFMRGMS